MSGRKEGFTMNRNIGKQELIDMVSDKLNEERIVIGGSRKKYKRKYHLKYTKVIITKVIDAFWDVIEDVIENGDRAIVKGYFSIYPKYYGKRQMNFFDGSKMMAEPRYKIRTTIGTKLIEACDRLLKKSKENKVTNPSPTEEGDA